METVNLMVEINDEERKTLEYLLDRKNKNREEFTKDEDEKLQKIILPFAKGICSEEGLDIDLAIHLNTLYLLFRDELKSMIGRNSEYNYILDFITKAMNDNKFMVTNFVILPFNGSEYISEIKNAPTGSYLIVSSFVKNENISNLFDNTDGLSSLLGFAHITPNKCVNVNTFIEIDDEMRSHDYYDLSSIVKEYNELDKTKIDAIEVNGLEFDGTTVEMLPPNIITEQLALIIASKIVKDEDSLSDEECEDMLELIKNSITPHMLTGGEIVTECGLLENITRAIYDCNTNLKLLLQLFHQITFISNDIRIVLIALHILCHKDNKADYSVLKNKLQVDRATQLADDYNNGGSKLKDAIIVNTLKLKQNKFDMLICNFLINEVFNMI